MEAPRQIKVIAVELIRAAIPLTFVLGSKKYKLKKKRKGEIQETASAMNVTKFNSVIWGKLEILNSILVRIS
jgi:hypothetical protein